MKEFVQLGNSIPQCESFRKRAKIIEATLSELLRKSTQIPPSHLLSIIRKQVKSQCAGVGCRQLERLFKKYLGMTPGEYLKIQRVEMARKWLENFLKKESIKNVPRSVLIQDIMINLILSKSFDPLRE